VVKVKESVRKEKNVKELENKRNVWLFRMQSERGWERVRGGERG